MIDSSNESPSVRRVVVNLCELCIAGKGGECHTPGCILWINRAPDLPLHQELIEDAPQWMLGDAMAAIAKFHRLGDQPIGAPLETDSELRVGLIAEELNEMSTALSGRDQDGRELTPDEQRVAVADALGDIIYVVIGSAVTWGIPIDRVFEAIHRSNMTKVEGGVTKRSDGKILKGPNYRPPDIRGALELPR